MIQIKSRFILAVAISLTLAACNQSDKKDDTTKVTDSTSTVKTDTTAAPAANAAMDAVTVAPANYKVLSDSMGIRIVEATYKPGDSSAMHTHPDYAIYVAEGGTATFYGKDGKKTVADMKTGMAMIKPAEAHSVKNTGKTALKVILFEVSRPMGAVATDATMDATKVAPEMYKVKADTMGIRILEINYKPGQSSAMHSHPDQALYVTDDGTAEFTAKDGTKKVVPLKKGMAMVGPAETHSVKNVGKAAMKAILVEVSRPMK